MFKKIVSNLSFSPALVGQLGFYAKRLRKEEATRRFGLIFVCLAVTVQLLAVFQAPQSANAASSNDFVAGGLGVGSQRSFNKYMVPYDANTNNLKDIMTGLGITREEITRTTYSSWIAGETYSWGRLPRLSAAQGLQTVNIPDANGNTILPVYPVKNKYINGVNARIYGWVGYSARVGWFGIMQACGNLVTNIVPTPVLPIKPTPPVIPPCRYNGSILQNNPNCKPCPGNPGAWYKDATCIPNIVESKSAVNLTQGNVDAATVTAQANDRIAYTITAKNAGLAPTEVPLVDPLADTLEYSTLVDAGAGTLDPKTKNLSWPTITLNPGETQSRTFAVQLLATIPATPVGQSDPISYNCKMSNGFGNNVDVKVECPPTKVVETLATELPRTGPGENLLFAGVVFGIVTYFFLRSKQLGKEVRLIRRDLNAGTI
ncbi:MAG: DUF11 domain-containing protein [Candidatus Microsaccharimonas sossegonensis]|uniref:DUF11 domain-containing protein n=1 Tax=Candidatus Microsaccharimonas sossegonensis TaxID=2506948 RepID=A0A4Q0AHB6_9BACT|nr:MAG: DUF11 domain-containing protein [Candidatus Microsaccharimonas sossegonensis]